MVKKVEMNAKKNHEEPKEKARVSLAEAVEKMNKDAGYDVPVVFALVNTLLVYSDDEMDYPPFEVTVDMAAIGDVLLKLGGGVLNDATMTMMMQLCMAYGWHRALTGKSLLRDKEVRDGIIAFAENTPIVKDVVEKKKVIVRGFEQLAQLLEKVTAECQAAEKAYQAKKEAKK